jgi:TolA-binding protein
MNAFRKIRFSIPILLLLFPLLALPQDTKENAEFKLAVNLYNDKLYDLAAEQLKRFIESYPNSPQSAQARFYLGLTQRELKQYEQARTSFQNFALSNPENPQAPDAWWNVGECYAAMDNPLEAASAFERLKVFHPKSKRAPEALLKSAHFFKVSNLPDRARKILRTLIQEYPTSEAVPEARLQLAETYLEEGNIGQALSELKRLTAKTKSGPLRAEALLLLGRAYHRQERLEDAQNAFAEVIQAFPKTKEYSEASLELGFLQQESGKYFESITSFKNVLADTTSPDISDRNRALLAIGQSYFELKDFQNSAVFAQKVLQQNPSGHLKFSALQLGATAKEKQKDFRGALDYYRSIVSDTSRAADRRIGYIGASRASKSLGDLQTAVSYLQTFVDEYPRDQNSPSALYMIGQLYEDDPSTLDGGKRAIAAYQELLSRYPRDPLVDDALFRIAQVQERSKEHEQALKSYNELIARYPSSSFVQEARARIRQINNFESTPTSASLNKMANLLASLIASESKGESAFHLGEIYFNDLKDYGAAAKMFSSAIENQVPEPSRGRSYYLRARSLQFLSEKGQLPADTVRRAYEEYLKLYPTDQYSADAAGEIALLRIATSKGDTAVKIAEEFVVKYPQATVGDRVVMAAADSMMTRGNYQRAALGYQQILSWFSPSSFGEEALYRLGVALEKLGKQDSAKVVFDSYSERYPKGTHTAEVLRASVRSALESGNPLEAINLLRKLRESFFYTPEAEKANVELARAYATGGQPDSAIAQCKKLVESEKDNLLEEISAVEPLSLLGKLYQEKGDKSAAKNYYLASLRDEGINLDQQRKATILARLSSLYREEGNYGPAISYLKQAVEIDQDRQKKKELADLYFELNDFSSAIVQFNDLAKSAGTDEERKESEKKAIISTLRMGKVAEAEAQIKQFGKTFKNADEALAEIELERGKYYFEKQNYTAALNVFQKLVKEFDDTKQAPAGQYWIGKIYEATGRTQDALKKYGEILKKYPRTEILPRVYLALGNVNYRTEKFDTALTYFKKVVDDSATGRDLLPFGMNNLIEAYKTVGLLDAALQLTRAFIEKFPDDESVQDKKIDVGVLYAKLGYYDQSILHLQNLLEEADADLEGEIRYYIGEAFFGKGEYDRAILEFLKVPYLVTKKGRVDWTANSFYMSGQAYEKMGKFDEAIGMYRQIVDRPGIDQTFKAAALKEIDRLNVALKRPTKQSSN